MAPSDLTTGTCRPQERADLLTRCLAVAYDPAAVCPTWERFLHRIMAGNQNLITFLQRAIGYALTGVIREHVLLILWGTGRNGKSTFLNTIRALLGPYAIKAPSELLMVSTNDRHPTERADLCGKRFVSAIETEQGRKLAEVFVKEATGGDPIRARRMREDFWEFQPTHKVFLATNHKPVITGTDTAIWERIRLVPFAVTIPPEERNPTLPEELEHELPGILAWAVQGCLAWQKQGLGMPEEVQQATAGYRTEMDVLGQFISECCLTGPNYRTKAATLYDAYKAWCDQQGIAYTVQRTWGMQLTDRGCERFTNNGTWYRNIGLLERQPKPTEGTEGTEGENGINSCENSSRDVIPKLPSVPSVPSVEEAVSPEPPLVPDDEVSPQGCLHIRVDRTMTCKDCGLSLYRRDRPDTSKE
jgi:putative DNA primase/helicase